MYEEKIVELGFSKEELIIKPLEPIRTPLINKVINVLNINIEHAKKIAILWDVDIDGMFAGYTAYKILSKIVNPDLLLNYVNETKVHGITRAFIRFCEENDIKTVIIVDAGTNDVEEIKELISMGMKVIVIDHHVKTEHYEDESFILINSHDMEVGQNVSGAYLVNQMMSRLHEHYFKTSISDYKEMAIISLVADVCERDAYNKNAILHFVYGKCKDTEIVNLFRSKYSPTTLSFIMSMTSTINAIIRNRGTRAMMHYMLNDLNGLQQLIEGKSALKEENENIVNQVINESKVFEMQNLIIVILNSKNNQGIYLRNYLGIIASKVSRLRGKLCLVLGNKEINYEVENKEYQFCFSARDITDRGALSSAIKSGLEANGHEPAFGGYLQSDFPLKIKKLDEMLGNEKSTKHNKFIRVPNVRTAVESLKGIMLPLSLWNSIQSEEHKIKLAFELEGQITKSGSIKKIQHNGLTYKSFEDNLSLGDTVYLVPEYNIKVDLIVVK